jgi:predicted ATP-grasp superfamily ATP-dependent carboligase
MESDGVGIQCNIPPLALEEQSTVTRAEITTYDALILDAYLRQSLVSVRSLGSKGLRIAALNTESAIPAFSSRWCQRSFVCPSSEASVGYLDYLEQLLELTGVRVLISSSDSTVALLRQNRERLEKRVCIALAKEPALAIAVNKEQTLEIANRLGLPVPRGVPVKSVDEVKAALHEIGLPAVVKPIESWVCREDAVENDSTGKRIVSQLVTTPEEAQFAVKELTSAGGTTLFQQFLTGRREAMSFLYANGEMYARFAQWAKRTEPPLGGQSVLRQSIAIPEDIGNQAERLVREIDLEGYSEVEFRRDSSGVPFLMEINPRLSASVEIAVRSGVDFPFLLYQWANGEKIERVQSYRVGFWMRHLKGDIMTTIEAIQQRGRPGVTPPVQSILGFCSSFFVPMAYDYFDWKDPKPAFIATRDFTNQWLGGAARKRFANLQRMMRGIEHHV